MRLWILLMLACVTALPLRASAAGETDVLPAMNFFSSIANNELFDIIKTNPAFSGLDKQLYGSPVAIRVTHSLRPTATGEAAGLLSAIWSGGTLGILPVVTNNSVAVTYEILVHGQPVATYTYQRTFTRAISIWVKDNSTYGLGHDGLEWLKSTASEFTAAAATDPRLLGLKQEYARYFNSKPS